MYYDRKASEAEYSIGKFVWRFYPPYAEKKLELGWIGPYLVIARISDVSYSIQKSPEGRIVNLHIDRIKPYQGENSPLPWVYQDGNPILSLENKTPKLTPDLFSVNMITLHT